MTKGNPAPIITFAFISLLNGIVLAAIYSDVWHSWRHGLGGIAIVCTASIAACWLAKKLHKKTSTKGTPCTLADAVTVIIFAACSSMLCIELQAYPEQIITVLLGTLSSACLLYAFLGALSSIFWGIFICIEIVQWVCYSNLGIKLSGGIIGEMLHATRNEISNILTPTYVWGIIAAAAASLLLSWGLHRALRNKNRAMLAYIGFLLLFVFECTLAVIPYNNRLAIAPTKKLNCLPYPIQETYGLLSAGYIGAQQDAKLLLNISRMQSPASAPSESTILQNNDGAICILHIGESVMASRLGFNGYHRNTTPWLGHQNKLISFPRCVSLYHITTTAIVAMLSDGARYESETESFNLVAPKLGNVADLFAKHGFYTAMLVGENAIQQKNTDVRYTFGEAMKMFTANMDTLQESPGDLQQQIKQTLQLCNEHKGRNIFIILNNEGSHAPFHVYDHNKPAFTPSNHKDFYKLTPQSSIYEINNAYDNTIVYTDDYIRQIAEGLKGRPFVYIYVSDHGEFLGKDNKYSRGWIFTYPTPQEGIKVYRSTPESLVGMFILPSDELLALHPHFAQACEQLRKNRQMTISQGHLFDSLLGLFGIKSEHYKPEWDLCSPEAQPYRGTQPEP